jgi:hypothetical protein
MQLTVGDDLAPDVPPVRVRGAGLFLREGPNRSLVTAFSPSVDFWSADGHSYHPQQSDAANDLGSPLHAVCALHFPENNRITHFTDGTTVLASNAGSRPRTWWRQLEHAQPQTVTAAAAALLADERALLADISAFGVTISETTPAVAGRHVHRRYPFPMDDWEPQALEWLVLRDGGALLAIGHTDGSLNVLTVDTSTDVLTVTKSEGGHTQPGISGLAWGVMSPAREPLLVVLSKDLTVWRISVPVVSVGESGLVAARERPVQRQPGADDGTHPPPGGLRVDATRLVALGRAALWPRLSLVEDLVTLTGDADSVPLYDAGLQPLAYHPGIALLRDLAWPPPARVGLAGLLAAPLPKADEHTPPPGSGAADRVAALRAALDTEAGGTGPPSTPLEPLLAGADAVTDRVVSLLAILGPDTVQEDPGLPLLLARWAVDMPPLDRDQVRLFAPRTSDGAARTRTNSHASGTSGISNRGAVTRLLPTQLALPLRILLLKQTRNELLYRLHTTEAEPYPTPVTLVLDTSPPTFGPAECLLRAAGHLVTTELWRHGRYPRLVTFDRPNQSVPIARPADLVLLWTTRTLDVPNVSTALATAAAIGAPTLLLTHHRLPQEHGLLPGPQLRLLTTHVADDEPRGRRTLPFHRHVPPSPDPKQLQRAVAALLAR